MQLSMENARLMGNQLSFNPSVEGQPLQRNTKMLNPIDVRCFNPSVEGQPLQPPQGENIMLTVTKFQSLCRGTAFATLDGECEINGKPTEFQSLCRGTAFATEYKNVKPYRC